MLKLESYSPIKGNKTAFAQKPVIDRRSGKTCSGSRNAASILASTHFSPSAATRGFSFVFLDAPNDQLATHEYERALKLVRRSHPHATIVCSRDLWQSAEARASGKNTLLGITTHYYHLGSQNDPMIKAALAYLKRIAPPPHIERL
jgi:hypothetical protein